MTATAGKISIESVWIELNLHLNTYRGIIHSHIQHHFLVWELQTAAQQHSENSQWNHWCPLCPPWWRSISSAASTELPPSSPLSGASAADPVQPCVTSWACWRIAPPHTRSYSTQPIRLIASHLARTVSNSALQQPPNCCERSSKCCKWMFYLL